MPLINSSQDILYIAIAIAVLIIGVLSGWAIFYLAMILRQSFQVIKETRERLRKVDEVINAIKEKVEHSASYLFLIGEGVKKLVEMMKSRTEKKARKKKEEKI